MVASSEKTGSLVIVGSGIKFLSHLTTEAKANINNADIVLYLLNDPAMQEWIQANSRCSESLNDIYAKYELRSKSYNAISDYILAVLRRNIHVCVVIYGHPTFLAQPTHDALMQARNEGYYANALPGISSEDCLYADLMIDPGTCGSQSFEATDFLLRRRKYDPASHLILFQIGYLGVLKHQEPVNHERVLKILVNYLSESYHEDHQIYIYEAAKYPGFDPRIDRLTLDELPKAKLSPVSTLYIPPAYKSEINGEILKLLDINQDELKTNKSDN